MTVPTITVPADKLVIVTGDHGGGYNVGVCVMCGAFGLLVKASHGVRHGSEMNELTHKRSCAVGALLHRDGNWRSER